MTKRGLAGRDTEPPHILVKELLKRTPQVPVAFSAKSFYVCIVESQPNGEVMIAFYGFVILIVLLLFWLIGKYNTLVTLRNQVENGWKQIDVQLKRRHDLIPNLVNTVKGYMEFEQETLEKVIKARNAAVTATGVGNIAAKEGELSGALSRLFALAENYPTLKANENVSGLQEELSSTENKISFARQFYNDIATKFNISQQVFPGNIVAQVFNFKEAELFEVKNTSEREVPTVDLSLKK